MVSLVLRRDRHEVIHHISEDKALDAAQRESFNLAILGCNDKDLLYLDLAHALTRYDGTLPLILIAYDLKKENEAVVAEIPFKEIWGMPLSPKRISASIAQYARM